METKTDREERPRDPFLEKMFEAGQKGYENRLSYGIAPSVHISDSNRWWLQLQSSDRLIDAPKRILEELRKTGRGYNLPREDGGNLEVMEQRTREYIKGFGLKALELNDWKTGLSALESLTPEGFNSVPVTQAQERVQTAFKNLMEVVRDELSK